MGDAPRVSLVGEWRHVQRCPHCKGERKFKHEDWQRSDGKWVRGGGYIPCLVCRGTGWVASAAPTAKKELEGSDDRH